ncbi:MAG: serine hydrolase, partial [Desulfosarcinaceae bacterium]
MPIIVFTLISALTISTRLGTALAISPGDSNLIAVATTRSGCPFTGSHTAIHSISQLIACIDNPGGSTYKTVDFNLKTNRILRLRAMGEGNPSKMLAYGGIENTETGQLIWVMDFLSTEDTAGIQAIRKADRLLPLRAGTYRLHFKSNLSRPPSKAIQAAAYSCSRGIWLFDETEQHKKLLDNFWEKATYPDEFGWSSVKLNRLNRELEKFGTDALMLITDGKIIFEYGNTTNIMRSHSVRKSLLSALYGIYVDEGSIDLNATLEQLNITESTPLTKQEKQATVLDLLRARSGVYIPAAAEAPSMRKARPQRGRHKPGSFWYYNNWDFNVLGTIFLQQTSQDLFQAFKQRIADPYPFLISARDMARFGQLFLQHGRWNKSQIIPENWIAASTTSYSHTNRFGIGYGYMWWILTEDECGLHKGCYFADGYGGQRLYVMPHINSVLVHLINTKVPGTNITTSDIAPDAVIKRIMKAYTGQKDPLGKSTFREKEELVAEKRLLDAHSRSAKYYGNSFRDFRIGFWICAVVLTSGFAVWTMLFLIRKGAGRSGTRGGNTGRNGLFAGLIKWIAAIGGLICSIYIYVILTIPHAFEYVAMVGM